MLLFPDNTDTTVHKGYSFTVLVNEVVKKRKKKFQKGMRDIQLTLWWVKILNFPILCHYVGIFYIWLQSVSWKPAVSLNVQALCSSGQHLIWMIYAMPKLNEKLCEQSFSRKLTHIHPALIYISGLLPLAEKTDEQSTILCSVYFLVYFVLLSLWDL